MKRFFYTSIFAIFLFGVSHLQPASDVLKFLDSHGGIDNSEGKPQAYKILPIPYKEQLSVYSGEQLKFYNEDQLNYIAGMVDRLKTTFSKEDLLICPGRSCIHFSNILKAHGYCVTSPSFSKGHIVLNAVRGSEYDNKEEKSAKQIELQEELRGFPKGYLDTKANLSGFLSKFEDLPAYVDFDAKEVKPAETLLVSRKQIEGYRKYLAEKCGISPDGVMHPQIWTIR